MIILSKNMKKYRVFLFLIFLLQVISFDGSASTRQDMGPKRLEVTHEYDKSYLQIKAHPFEIAGVCFTAFLFIFFLTKKRKHKKELDRVHTELPSPSMPSIWPYGGTMSKKRFSRQCTVSASRLPV